MIEPPPSIGTQMDALVAHLNERLDRIASDLSHANARIEGLQARIAVAGIAITIVAGIAGMALGLAIKWIV